MSRLIDADALTERLNEYANDDWNVSLGGVFTDAVDTCLDFVENAPTIEAVPVVNAEWILEAHNERVNYRWNVTAKCSECEYSKGEIWVGFFPGVPNSLAETVAIDCAEQVKISNFCPNCGADMRKGGANQ